MCTGTGHLVQLVEMCCCSHSLCMYVYRDGALGAVRDVLLFSLSVYVCVQGRGTWCSLLEMCYCSHCLCMYVYRDGTLGAAC